jgi:hypothetical protein
MSGNYFFTIQDPILCKIDEKLQLVSYGGKVNREKTYDRHAKKKEKVLDEVFDGV